ncbi:MAG: class I SAM-dependent methyltransferase [Chloroflexota bacterium]
MNAAEYEAMYRLEDTLWWYVGMRRIGEALLGGRLQPGLRILDAGAGTGGNLRWLSRFGAAHGIDVAPDANRFCSERGLSTVARASVAHLPYRNATFDLVTSFDVIYHLGVSDDVGALREAARVLKPGGTLLVRVPAFNVLRSEHDAAVHTRQRYTLDELRAKVTRAGLRVRRATYANTVLFPIAAVARLAGRMRPAGSQDDRSDVHAVSPIANAAFGTALDLEAALLARWDMPVGLSALVVAERE